MTAEQFLERLIADGNYIAIAFKGPGMPMAHRFYPRTHIKDAAGFIRWCATKGTEVWHACASYKDATAAKNTQGRDIWKGERKQDNVENLRAFWLDLDIKRHGDGKDAAKVYADIGAAIVWLRQFLATTSMPPPNLWVNSGYGLHLYWVLEDAIDRLTWQPYSEALKAAVVATGGLADLVVIADSARILRPPQSNNFKVPANPAPVSVLTTQSKGDYPNAIVYAALQAYVGQATPGTTVAASGAALGPAPAHVQTSGLNAASQAAQAVPKDKSFALIAAQCQQVKHSLATHGAADTRTIWYLGNLSLAHHTVDGDAFVHDISNGHPRYTQADTDAMVAQVAAEKAKKDTGPPRCSFYNQNRAGICDTCPHFGKLVSPWNAGAPDGDLPQNYRRQGASVQKAAKNKEGVVIWDHLFEGDVYGPVLSRLGGSFSLSFTYEFAGVRYPVSGCQPNIGPEVGAAIKLWGSQGITLDRFNAQPFGDFFVAWIRKLRAQRAERITVVDAFGWAEDEANKIVGFASGGLLYREDGTTEQVPGADATLAEAYRPRGDIENWKRAAKLITKGRPDTQMMLAAAMGAPLMRFAGQPGVVFNFYSRDSGVGKSSASMIAQNVWATTDQLTMLDDTGNAVRGKTAETRVMPLIWDEMRVNAENVREKTDMMFAIAQGKDKTRMRSDASIRAAKTWQTIMITTSNAPLMEYITSTSNNTDAGGLRVMDFEIDVPRLKADATHSLTFGAAGTAAGRPGALLAAKYAKDATAIKTRVLAWNAHLSTEMGCTNEERFYLAGIACAFTAAQIAKNLGLLDFDVAAMWGYTKSRWNRLREQRGGALVNSGAFNLNEIFGRFMGSIGANILVTNYYKGRGAAKLDFGIAIAPLQVHTPILAHASQRDLLLRVDKHTIQTWLRKEGLPAGEVLKAMKDRWRTREDRIQLGSGTMYPNGGQKAIIEIPLTHSDLDDYDYGIDTKDPNYVPSPAKLPPSQAVAGNQVKV